MEIYPITQDNRAQIDQYICEEWGGPTLVTLGNAYDASTLPGFCVLINEQLEGAILYRIEGDSCEIAVLFAKTERRGIGTALIHRVLEEATELNCKRVWLVTSNDNTNAIRFYQKRGFILKAVHINSFDIIRTFKPNLPAIGIDGIPLAHEFEFEWLL